MAMCGQCLSDRLQMEHVTRSRELQYQPLHSACKRHPVHLRIDSTNDRGTGILRSKLQWQSGLPTIQGLHGARGTLLEHLRVTVSKEKARDAAESTWIQIERHERSSVRFVCKAVGSGISWYTDVTR